MPWRIVFQFGPPPAVDDGMSGWACFGIVVLCIASYIFISSIMASFVGEDDTDPVGLLWPVLSPWVLGSYIARQIKARRTDLPQAKVVKK